MKNQAIEIVGKILPLMQAHIGSDMAFRPEIALKNAKECCQIIGAPLLEEIQKLTVNDFWTETELEKFKP